MLPGRLPCGQAQAGDAAWGWGWGTATLCPRGLKEKSPPLLGETPGMNTAANEQTEPEELKENKGGREGGTDGQAWGKAAFSGIPHPCPGAQKPLPGSKGQGKLGSQIGGGGAHLPPRARTDSPETGRELRQSCF